MFNQSAIITKVLIKKVYYLLKRRQSFIDGRLY